MLRFDDSVDIFAVHAIGGFAGNMMTALFADARVMAYDGTVAPGGELESFAICLSPAFR